MPFFVNFLHNPCGENNNVVFVGAKVKGVSKNKEIHKIFALSHLENKVFHNL